MIYAVGMRCPTLVGRDAELGALRAHLAAALDGHGGFMMVRGEAGFGKPRLCRELIDAVRARECLSRSGVLSARRRARRTVRLRRLSSGLCGPAACRPRAGTGAVAACA
jgi:hypothetical protein